MIEELEKAAMAVHHGSSGRPVTRMILSANVGRELIWHRIDYVHHRYRTNSRKKKAGKLEISGLFKALKRIS